METVLQVCQHERPTRGITLALCGRDLPELAIYTVVGDGEDIAVVAAAFDLSCAAVRHIVKEVDEMFTTRHVEDVPLCDRTLRKKGELFCQIYTAYAGNDWLAFLTPRERVEVTEARSYLCAFKNRVV